MTKNNFEYKSIPKPFMHEGTELIVKIVEGGYKCAGCDLVFTARSRVVRHGEKIHSYPKGKHLFDPGTLAQLQHLRTYQSDLSFSSRLSQL